MSTNAPEISVENAPPPTPSSFERMVNVFTEPSRAFADLERKPDWAAPWLVASLLSLLFGFVFVTKIDMEHFSRQQVEQSGRAAQFEKLSPEQQETQIRVMAKVTEIFVFLAPVGLLVVALVIAAIFMAVFNFVLAAGVPFKVCIAIVFYAWMPLAISSILTAAALYLNSDPNSFNVKNPIATNPAYFMDPNSQKFLYGLAQGLDVISLWVVVLVGIGFSVNSARGKLSRGTAINTALVVYAIYALGKAALNTAF